MGRVAVPVWDLHGIEKLPLDPVVRPRAIDLEVVLREHQKVILVGVKLMVLQRPILDGPVLDRALRGHDAGRIVGVEEPGRRSLHRDEELPERVVFREIEGALRRDRRSRAYSTRS